MNDDKKIFDWNDYAGEHNEKIIENLLALDSISIEELVKIFFPARTIKYSIPQNMDKQHPSMKQKLAKDILINYLESAFKILLAGGDIAFSKNTLLNPREGLIFLISCNLIPLDLSDF